MPSEPGPIPLELAAELARLRPPGVPSPSSSSARSADMLAREAETVQPLALRIVQRLGAGVRRPRRRGFLGLRLVGVVRVEGPEALEEARASAEAADALLLDPGRPRADPPELAGTGCPHDRRPARTIVEALWPPIFLAGGSRPETVGAAIGAVRPSSIDPCGGVRRVGRLDAGRRIAFVRSVATAPGIGAIPEAGAERVSPLG